MDMNANGPTPDSVTYATILDGLCMQGRVDEALTLFQTMKKHSVKPDIVIYSILIGGMCNSGKVKHAWELFNSLSLKGLRPDARTCI
ncbi:hypothetical protein Tsubulata_049195 [Turnera subulata]|uniref:Pentacotripeptide-repeat region of PRORP domain-containing protein n=1 Tax=Turnera subulata TaxID=218843 RepID=A0A9Q0GBA4_9ROSI|nr:hypothetical protein Tsubulata_049195 [Turnera subulata]